MGRLSFSPPRVARVQGPCCSGTGSSGLRAGGIPGLREARESSMGATQNTLRGAGRGWVKWGWHWEMAEAVVRGRRQQAFGAAGTGPPGWGRGQPPFLPPQPHPYIGRAPLQHPRYLSLLTPQPRKKTPLKFGKLDGCQLTEKLLPGGGSLLPQPHSRFSCAHGLPPGRGILGCGGCPRNYQEGLGWSCQRLSLGHVLLQSVNTPRLGQH